MNVVFYRYRSICEPDYLDAFKSIGLNVVEDIDGMSGDVCLDEKINNLGMLIAQNKPLFVFSINYYPFISIVCEKLHVFYIAVTVDCPVFEIFNTTIRNGFNRLFLFDKEQFNMVRKENPNYIFHLPLGAAPQRLDKILENVKGYMYDISFVGSLYNEKDPLQSIRFLPDDLVNIIDNAIDDQMRGDVFGHSCLDMIINEDLVNRLKELDNDFYPSDMSVFDISHYVAINDYLCPHFTYKERVAILDMLSEKCGGKVHLFTNSNTKDILNKVEIHSGVDSLKEMPLIFKLSKINLNITVRSIASGLPQRIWDVLACGGFLITNYQPEIDEYFKNGEQIVTYNSYEELVDKVNYYMVHDKEREKIAYNGYCLVKEKGKVVDRVLEMIRLSIGGARGHVND